MPRSRGGRPAARPAGRAASPPPPSAPAGARPYTTTTHSAAPPPAAPQPTAPAPQASYAPAPSSGGGMMSGLMGTVAQGMALGTGSAIAHRTIDAAWGSMFGSGQSQPEPAQIQATAQQLQQAHHPCADAAQAFADCMSKNNGDMGACEYFYNSMQQCKLANA